MVIRQDTPKVVPTGDKKNPQFKVREELPGVLDLLADVTGDESLGEYNPDNGGFMPSRFLMEQPEAFQQKADAYADEHIVKVKALEGASGELVLHTNNIVAVLRGFDDYEVSENAIKHSLANVLSQPDNSDLVKQLSNLVDVLRQTEKALGRPTF